MSERGPLNIVVLCSQIHCSKGMSVRTGQRNKDLQDADSMQNVNLSSLFCSNWHENQYSGD